MSNLDVSELLYLITSVERSIVKNGGIHAITGWDGTETVVKDHVYYLSAPIGSQVLNFATRYRAQQREQAAKDHIDAIAASWSS